MSDSNEPEVEVDGSAASLGSTDIPVDDCSGEMVDIYKHELALLRKVAESASDLVLGTLDREFASRNGGKDSLFDILAAHVRRHAEWLSGFDGP